MDWALLRLNNTPFIPNFYLNTPPKVNLNHFILLNQERLLTGKYMGNQLNIPTEAVLGFVLIETRHTMSIQITRESWQRVVAFARKIILLKRRLSTSVSRFGCTNVKHSFAAAISKKSCNLTT